MTEINVILDHVAKSCAARGKQLTAKRKLVLKALLHADKALSAYDLVDYCKEHFEETIQAMTVYRVLDFLENEHFAHKLKVSNKYIMCSHILCDHDHGTPQFLICSKCDKITEHTIAPIIMTGLHLKRNKKGLLLLSRNLKLAVCVMSVLINVSPVYSIYFPIFKLSISSQKENEEHYVSNAH